MTKGKTHKVAHTPKSSKGSGDFYGTGVKQKMGIMRESNMDFGATSPKKLKKPPKSLA